MAAAIAAAPPAVAAPGPRLREDPAKLAAALECSPGVDVAAVPPVLLIHGTTSSPEESWSWGYRKVLPELGRPTCTVRLPDRAVVDLQRSAEYVVYATRAVAARTPGHRIGVIGHSQGAFHAVFTQKFWPDLAGLVDDAVLLSGPFREAEGLQAGCNPASCSPPFRQRQKGSRFFGAFLVAPLPAGPSFTSVLTLQDEVTRPQPASSTLAPSPAAAVRNITLQDLCPGRSTEHLGMLGDAVVFQLVLDAFTHAGPADPARITAACGAERFPGTDDALYTRSMGSALASLVTAGATADQSPMEPPVRCYLDPACADVTERGAMLTAATPRARGRGRDPRRRLVLDVQSAGVVRVIVARSGREVARVIRRLTPGRRTLILPRKAVATTGRHTVTIETRPGAYTRYAVERRASYKVA